MLIALSGGAASGKDAQAKRLVERLAHARLISGSAVFRSIALWLLEQGHPPHRPVPPTAFASIALTQYDDLSVRVEQESTSWLYTPEDYSTSQAAQAGSLYAHNSDSYTAYAFRAIRQQIHRHSTEDTWSIIGARDAFRIADATPAPHLKVYLFADPHVQLARLRERYQDLPDTDREQSIREDLLRDARDRANGTLPNPQSTRPLHVATRPSTTTYGLDNSALTLEESTDAFLRVLEQF